MSFSFSTTFPLLVKELSELANRQRTYIVRTVYTAILFSCGLLILYGRGGVSADPSQRLGEGQAMFLQLVWLQYAGIFMFLPAMSAGAFTNEKERDTLTLLLLTTMPPWTILIQKFLSRVIPMLCFVVLSFPLMAVAYSYGGVTTQNLYSVMLLLIFAVLQVAALTLMCSAFCRTTVESFLASYGVLLLFNTCCPIFSPLPIWGASQNAAVILSRLALVFISTIACLVAARIFLLSRAFVPPRNIMLEAFQGMDRVFNDANVVTGGVVLVKDGSQFPDTKPVAWRETSKKSLGTFRYLFRVLVVLEIPILFVAQQLRLNAIQSDSAVSILLYLLWIIAVAMTCIHASSVVSAERSRQTLDSLLTAPISGQQLMKEKLAGVQRLINVLLIPFATIYIFHHWLRDYNQDYTYLGISLATAIILPRCIAWIAFWIGLKMKSQMKAITTTLGVVAVAAFLPRLIQFLTNALGVAIPEWLNYAFMLSPATLIQRLESWYQMSNYTNDVVLSSTINLCVVLCVYTVLLFLVRFHCLRNADALLGRVPEGLPSSEDVESEE